MMRPPIADKLARLLAPTSLIFALAGCGGGSGDPVLAYVESAEPATASVRVMSSNPLLQAGLGAPANLIVNGSFDASVGPTTAWTQRTARTRFDGSDVIGPPLLGRPVPPGAGANAQVARFCGYPYNKQTILPDGTVLNDAVSCSDRLTSDAFTIPANASAITVQVNALAQFQCPELTWQTVVALFPVAGGTKVPALRIRLDTPNFQQNVWQTLSFDVPAERVAPLAGQLVQLVTLGQSGSCSDPAMANSFVLLSGFKVLAN